MLKGIVLCGGIWAATATSVALVRYPQIIEEPLGEDEVETLSPEDFTFEKGESTFPFASRYSSYFAATTESNKKFWEDRFREKSKGQGKIELGQNSDSKLEIVSAWDGPKEKEEGKISLVGFCEGGYSAKFTFSDPDKWDLFHPSNSYLDLEPSNLWSLCSVFSSKPETLCDNNDKQGVSLYSSPEIGHEIHQNLVRADVSHVFWDIREQEWRAIEVEDSVYFGEDKKKNNSIKDLCEKAYKQKASNVDNADIPSFKTVAKYCRLEWIWD